MKILVVDANALALDFCLRAIAVGHEVKWFIRDRGRSERDIGKGLVPKVNDWAAHMRWADLIFVPDNAAYMQQLQWYHDKGFPVYGATEATAKWELERNTGMDVLKAAGVRVVDGVPFNSFQKAAEYVKRTDARYVCKPDGDVDKALTYVAKSPEDMVYMLETWAKTRPATKFILQPFVPGIEMAVGAWVGPNGFASPWNENFEFKKLMPGDTGPACFTPDAEVLTKEGWKFWPEVTMDDEICTLLDGSITFEKPSQLVAEHFEGELIGWRSLTTDILVTPGHQMLVQDDHCRKDFWFEPAGVTCTKKRVIALGGLGQWHGAVHAPEKAALWGAVLADGHLRDRSVVFGNCPPHKQKAFTAIAAAAGYSARLYGRDLYINSADLVREFGGMGHAHTKRVPGWVQDGDVETIKAFLQGYAAGDGSNRKANLIITTASKGMADDLQTLALKAGWVAKINTRDRRGQAHVVKGNLCVNRRIAYDVSIAQRSNKAELSPKTSYRQPYIGTVYCVTVSSHKIYTRFNGKPCWIGQTGEQGTIMRYVEQSKLADKVLKPLEQMLVDNGHIGYVDVNCIIDEKGNPVPLEFTMRPGWPHFNIAQQLHTDIAQWMVDSLYGHDVRDYFITDDIAAGFVVSIPDYPYGKMSRKEVSGVPIYGIDANQRSIHLCEAKAGSAPQKIGKTIKTAPIIVSAGVYLLVTACAAPTVSAAAKAAEKVAKSLVIPCSPMWRVDIGQRLQSQLPKLQAMGYAKGMKF